MGLRSRQRQKDVCPPVKRLDTPWIGQVCQSHWRSLSGSGIISRVCCTRCSPIFTQTIAGPFRNTALNFMYHLGGNCVAGVPRRSCSRRVRTRRRGATVTFVTWVTLPPPAYTKCARCYRGVFFSFSVPSRFERSPYSGW